jgi:murein DD-endopeptidase MepM/ murein hydrolase activator NlpD
MRSAGSVPRVTSLGRGRGRWYLAVLGVAVLVAIGVGTLIENRAPAATTQASGPAAGWSSPSLSSSSAATPVPTAAGPVPTSAAPAPPRYVFPVTGNVSYARTHHDYPASDVIAPCGSTVRAVTDGVILEVNRTDTYNVAVDDGATRGGLYVSLLGDDGVRYYGSHYKSIGAVIEAGHRVKAGDPLGAVGESGDASACHLHFGISAPCAQVGDWWIRRGVIWPWSYLDSWKAGQSKSPAAEVAAWSRAHGCPPAP